MTDLTERLRWLLADATPGPWKRKGNDVLDPEGGLIVSFTTAFRANATQKKRDKADPNLVAEAITALPNLLTTLETLTQENARLREALEEIVGRNLVTEWTATRENPESHWETRYGKFATIARKALGGGDEG